MAISIKVSNNIQSNGIVGTTTNNNADAGYVGEFVTASRSTASPLSLTSTIPAAVTSISLTAGDWDVWAKGGIIPSTGVNATLISGDINTTSGASFDANTAISALPINGVLYNQPYTFSIEARRASLSATTTYYLNVGINFSGGSVTGFGTIYARRRR